MKKHRNTKVSYKNLVTGKVRRTLSKRFIGKPSASTKELSRKCKHILWNSYDIRDVYKWENNKAIYHLYYTLYVGNKDMSLEVVLSSKFYNTDQWRLLREEVFTDYGYACMCCGYESKSNHIDHIKPKSKYPELALDINNLQVLCQECNTTKGNWDESDYRYGDTGIGFTFPWDDKITW